MNKSLAEGPNRRTFFTDPLGKPGQTGVMDASLAAAEGVGREKRSQRDHGGIPRYSGRYGHGEERQWR